MKKSRYKPFLLLAFVIVLNGCSYLIPSHHRTEDYTPVFAAATNGDLAFVKQAVQNDPTIVDAKEWEDATLLHDAVAQNHADVAKFLLENGADVNAVKTDRVTPMHIAARNGNIAIMKLLIDHQALINPVDSEGWTPLDRAEKWGQPAAVKFLRQHGGHHHVV